MAKNVQGQKVKAKRIGDLQEVANKNPIGPAAAKYNHIRVQLSDGKELSLLFTDNEILRAKYRAERNPEDVPSVSWLRDILD